MIYIVKGPCKGCEMMCNGVQQACNESCKCFSGICRKLGECWNETIGGVYHKPMGGYVVFSWFTAVAVIACSAYGYTSIDCGGESTDLATYNLLGAIGVAVVHALVAFWIQRKILVECVKELDRDYDAQGTAQEERDYDISNDNYHARIRRAVLEVIKYDFIFCFYFFFFPAAFGFACWAMQPLVECSSKSWVPSWAFGLLIGYGALVGFYFLFQMCGVCCGSGKEKVQKKVKKAKAVKKGRADEGQTVGQPAAIGRPEALV